MLYFYNIFGNTGCEGQAMERNFNVATTIHRSIEDVFNAIVEREQLAQYFTDSADRGLDTRGRTVWHWTNWGDHPVTVTRVEAPRLIEFTINSGDWSKTEADHYDIICAIELETLENGETKVNISERGWKTDSASIKASHEQCGGWMHMVLCLKAYLQHGIDLRE